MADATHAAEPKTPAELDEDAYLRQVLQQTADGADDFFSDLLAKAESLGILISRPSTVLSRVAGPAMSGAESSLTLDTSHARTASTGSGGSASTPLTSNSSSRGNSTFPVGILARKRSRSLTFAQYDKYLAQVDTDFSQPRFLSQSPPDSHAEPSLFSVSTRKSLTNIKQRFCKMRRKRKATPLPAVDPIVSVSSASIYVGLVTKLITVTVPAARAEKISSPTSPWKNYRAGIAIARDVSAS